MEPVPFGELRAWAVWWCARGLGVGLWGVLVCGCGGVYEALAPAGLSAVDVALSPDTVRQGDDALVMVLLFDVSKEASFRVMSLQVDADMEVLSLRTEEDPSCVEVVAAGVAVPARFVERDPRKLCLRLQPSPVASVGEKQVRLEVEVDNAPRLAKASVFVLQALRP
jgi:hypothetical protein